jgi:hypothetical protein
VESNLASNPVELLEFQKVSTLIEEPILVSMGPESLETTLSPLEAKLLVKMQ